MAFCPGCGAPDPGTGSFCMKCGTPLRGATAPAIAAGAPVEMPPTVIVRPGIDQKQQVANYWHTLALVGLLFLVSFGGAHSQHKAAGTLGRPFFYLTLMAYEWLLVGFVFIGIRRRNFKLSEIVGGRWKNIGDVLIDIAIAAGFWLCAAVVLAALSFALGLAHRAEELRKSIEFLAPGTALEIGLWVLVSSTAGICEEIIFRGYLQRQFASLARSVVVGVIAAAVIFGASHAYEGGARMIVIGVFGALFGTLAALRGSLRPGMIAHAWHDTLSGVMIGILRRSGR